MDSAKDIAAVAEAVKVVNAVNAAATATTGAATTVDNVNHKTLRDAIVNSPFSSFGGVIMLVCAAVLFFKGTQNETAAGFVTLGLTLLGVRDGFQFGKKS